MIVARGRPKDLPFRWRLPPRPASPPGGDPFRGWFPASVAGEDRAIFPCRRGALRRTAMLPPKTRVVAHSLLRARHLDRLDFDASKIDRPGRRSAHALRLPAREICAIGSSEFWKTINRWPSWSVAVTEGRSMWPAPEARIFRPSSPERPCPWISRSPFASSVFQTPNSLPSRASPATSRSVGRFHSEARVRAR